MTVEYILTVGNSPATKHARLSDAMAAASIEKITRFERSITMRRNGFMVGGVAYKAGQKEPAKRFGELDVSGRMK